MAASGPSISPLECILSLLQEVLQEATALRQSRISIADAAELPSSASMMEMCSSIWGKLTNCDDDHYDS